MQVSSDSIEVLHVDDDPELADTVAAFVEREDERFAVETAGSASEGLDRLARGDFDCVVSDYEMPERNGIEFLAAVREDHPDLPFVLYTGRGSEEVASEAISAGVTEYLQKGNGTSQYTVLANRIANAVEKHHAQAELRDRERRLALLFEQSPLGVVEWSERLEVVRLNEAGEEILAADEADLVGRPWETLVADAEAPVLEAAEAALLEGAGHHRGVIETVRRDGERIVCEWHSRAVSDGEDVAAIFSQFQDVTERRRQKRQLETLVDNVPGMVYRCENERGWPMEEVRGEVERLTGYAASAIESREGFYGREVIHPEDQDDVWEAVQTATEAGESFEVTYRIVTRGGDTRWVWERGRKVDPETGDGEVLEGFVTDVTEREAARRELAAERAFVEQAIDALEDLFYVVGTDGDLQRWNTQVTEVTGYSDAELTEMRAVDLFPEELRPRAVAAIEETVATGSAVARLEVRRADGERVPYEFTGSRLTDADGNTTGLVGIGRRVADRD